MTWDKLVSSDSLGHQAHRVPFSHGLGVDLQSQDPRMLLATGSSKGKCASALVPGQQLLFGAKRKI